MNKLILITVLLLLAGCIGVSNYRSENGGKISVPGPEYIQSEVEASANQACLSKGKKLISLQEGESGWGWGAYRNFVYECENAYSNKNDYSIRDEDINSTSNLELIETKPKAPDPTNIELQNIVSKQKNNGDDENRKNESQKIKINEAKSRCVELGFKPKTEKFGKCVLELTN
jgi:hypothetical protein